MTDQTPEQINCDELRDAALWVVLRWDTDQSQHGSMSALRRALGLPGEPPTREEGQKRMLARLSVVESQAGFEIVRDVATGMEKLRSRS